MAYLSDRVFSRNQERGGGVVLRGSAGIGKSRLVDEFVSDVRSMKARVGVGRAREFANAPYLAVDEALRELDVELELGLAADVDQPQRFAAIAQAIQTHAERAGGVDVLVVEDLHWADRGTIELIRFLAVRLKNTPALVVATYRNDAVEADPIRAAALEALERDAGYVVTLEALPPAIIDKVLSAALSGVGVKLPLQTLARVSELSDGRPLFAEELLRGVLERLDRDGTAEPTVPTSIRASVRERFLALNDVDRDVLLHAAVIGRRFSASFVAALVGCPAATVYSALRRARSLQLVEEQNDADGDGFAFRHALTREAIYAELLRAESRLLHRRVAHELTRSEPLDVAAVAEHTWRGGDDAAGVWNERAGDEALAVQAYADAAVAFERAYTVSQDPEVRARVSVRVAEALYAVGQTERTAEWYATSASDHAEAGLTRRAASLRLRHARVLVEAGRYADGLFEADRIATAPGIDWELRFEADVMVAGLLAATGRPAEALDRLERAPREGSHPDAAVRARYDGTLACAFYLLGRASEARSRFVEAAEGANLAGDLDLVVRTLNNWGNLELGYGHLGRGRTLYAEALAAAEEMKNLRQVALLAQNGGLGAVLAGDLAEARSLLARSNAIEHGVSRVVTWSSAIELRLKQLVGEPDPVALERSIAALEKALRVNDLSTGALLAAVIAYGYAADGRLVEAADVAGSVVAILDVAEPPYWLLDAAGRFGEPIVRDRARALLREIAEREDAVPARGFLAMADARAAARARRREDAVGYAELAVSAFREAGWNLDLAYALELGGRTAEAVAAFEAAGAVGEVRRLTATESAPARRRGEATLTAREREIASMVSVGRSTRAIAEGLVISERTVETHIASVYRKFGVASRRELADLLARAGTASG
ncbi:MAG: transcriptional regulator, LuxR family [Candidatus Eremiobacteraeota bacterium]|nr:transcriptional regulator, LuxR family [Candidatus Eremiobacteraeota bacterium]